MFVTYFLVTGWLVCVLNNCKMRRLTYQQISDESKADLSRAMQSKAADQSRIPWVKLQQSFRCSLAEPHAFHRWPFIIGEQLLDECTIANNSFTAQRSAINAPVTANANVIPKPDGNQNGMVSLLFLAAVPGPDPTKHKPTKSNIYRWSTVWNLLKFVFQCDLFALQLKVWERRMPGIWKHPTLPPHLPLASLGSSSNTCQAAPQTKSLKCNWAEDLQATGIPTNLLY